MDNSKMFEKYKELLKKHNENPEQTFSSEDLDFMSKVWRTLTPEQNQEILIYYLENHK